jgi:hypothetical protein
MSEVQVLRDRFDPYDDGVFDPGLDRIGEMVSQLCRSVAELNERLKAVAARVEATERVTEKRLVAIEDWKDAAATCP